MLDKEELQRKIAEILVLSQFEYWIEPQPPFPTAGWIEERENRAFDYYLGKTKTKIPNDFKESLAMNRFHNIVHIQVGLIMRGVEESQLLVPVNP